MRQNVTPHETEENHIKMALIAVPFVTVPDRRNIEETNSGDQNDKQDRFIHNFGLTVNKWYRLANSGLYKTEKRLDWLFPSDRCGAIQEGPPDQLYTTLMIIVSQRLLRTGEVALGFELINLFPSYPETGFQE